VKTVGTLITVVGGVVGAAGLRDEVTPEIPWLAAGTAAGLAAIDVVYALHGRISPVYLLDAAVELTLMGCWWLASRGRAEAEKETREGLAAVVSR
jgi:hypothetical protein